MEGVEGSRVCERTVTVAFAGISFVKTSMAHHSRDGGIIIQVWIERAYISTNDSR